MLNSAVIFSHTGTMELKLSDSVRINVTLSEHQHEQIVSMLERFYAENQTNYAELVGAPLPQLADFSEV